jgi:hypothetical protein
MASSKDQFRPFLFNYCCPPQTLVAPDDSRWSTSGPLPANWVRGVAMTAQDELNSHLHVQLHPPHAVTSRWHWLSSGIGSGRGAVVVLQESTESLAALHFAGWERQDAWLAGILGCGNGEWNVAPGLVGTSAVVVLRGAWRLVDGSSLITLVLVASTQGLPPRSTIVLSQPANTYRPTSSTSCRMVLLSKSTAICCARH